MHITILALGSRGDIQPNVTLGSALKAAGHQVRFITFESFSSLIAEHELDFHPIRGDAQQLRQVIHNLLQNALDASEAVLAAAPPGQQPAHAHAAPEVMIRTRLGDSGQRVRLTVQDSGTGFPEHILKRAFEPYVTTKSKGTGLGLAVVKKIADDHGARIELSNRMFEGAVAGAQVSLSFALASEAQVALAHTESSRAPIA